MVIPYLHLVLAAHFLAAGVCSAYHGRINISTRRGSSECPCTDTSRMLAAQTNCIFEDASGSEPGILANGRCYPLSYGSTECNAWDLATSSDCQQELAPAYCIQRFCYVDPEQCRLSSEHYYQSQHFPGLYYSYSTCGSTAQDWLTFETTDTLANTSLVAVVPSILWPNHYKIDPSGQGVVHPDSPQAYNSSLPWTGYMIDYFNDVMGISNVQSVRYVHRSRGSKTKGYSGQFTQSVTDVEAGIVDVGVSSYWVTAERLALTPFTVPFGSDSIKLWVPYSESDSEVGIYQNFLKLSRPFSDGLWASIGLTILVYAILSVVVSPAMHEGRHFENKAMSFPEKIKRSLMVMTDALSVSTLDFLGRGLDPTTVSNVPQKWLNLGFALVIFIGVSAYTANLAAFLTIQAATKHISNIEEAIAASIPVCASSVLQPELQLLYPRAQWVFRPEAHLVQEAYGEGLCGGLVQGWVEIRADPRSQKWFCERGLIRVGNTLLDKLLAFPANHRIVGGLSHYIIEAQSQGILFESYVTQTEAQCRLDIQIVDGSEENEVESDLNQLTPKHMAVPLTVFACCCVVALLFHICDNWIWRPKQDVSRVKERSSSWSIGVTCPSSKDEAEEISKPLRLVRPSPGTEKPPIAPLHQIQSMESATQTMKELLAYQQALLQHMDNLSPNHSKGGSCYKPYHSEGGGCYNTQHVREDDDAMTAVYC